MQVSKTAQYSVFLVNEPGSLKDLAQIMTENDINIIGMASDIRYEAAIIRIVPDKTQQEIDIARILTQGGYTCVKTDILCLILPNKKGALVKISGLLGANDINITNIYGSAYGDNGSRIFLVVNDLEKAMSLLTEAEF